MIPTLRKNDAGTAIRIAVTENAAPVDLTAATSVTMLFKSPWGNYTQQPATIVNDGGTTKIQYITASEDLNTLGTWSVQGHFTLSGWSGTTSENEFYVQEVFE